MFENIHRIYFIGIGGMGVSALAKLACDAGISVFGSDLSRNKTTEALESAGAIIAYGKQSAENIPECVDVVVYSRAITRENAEYQAAQKRNISIASYPEYVGKITRGKKVIAVSGTHGKTTTTGLIGKMLIDAGFDPTVIVGSYLSDFNGNAYLGEGEYVVLEADEYRNAFEHYHPEIAIVTTIDFDHPDYFTDLADVKKHFASFLSNSKKHATIVANNEDENVVEVVGSISKEVLMYGHNSELEARNISFVDQYSVFDVQGIEEIKLSISGKHNINNSLAAIAVAQKLGIDESNIRKTFSEYHGAWRRFELLGRKNDIIVIDDYAHHPREIEVTVEAARGRFPESRIIAVFQPHHEERIRVLFDTFAQSLSIADICVLTDIYRVPGRTIGVDLDISEMAKMVEKTGKKSYYIPKMEEIPSLISEVAQPKDVILIMGAGNINSISGSILKAL